MKHFKLPLIVTAIVLPLMLVVGIGAIYWIFQLEIPESQKAERGGKAGSAIATMGCIILAPFWWVAAAKAGKALRERRLAR